MDILFGKNQFTVIISFFVCGIICGIIFDIFKIKRRIFGSPYIVLLIDDLIFMLSVAVIVIFNAYAFNNGNMKWYESPAMLFGFWIYRKTMSVIFIKVSFFIIDKIKLLITKLLIPVKKIYFIFRIIFINLLLNIYTFKCKKQFLSYRL